MWIDTTKLQPYPIRAYEFSSDLEWLFDYDAACVGVYVRQFVGFMSDCPVLLEWCDGSDEVRMTCVDSNCNTDVIEQYLYNLYSDTIEHAYLFGKGPVFTWTPRHDYLGHGEYILKFYMYDAETTPGGIYK